MSRKRVFRTLLVVTALSIGLFGSGSVAFAQHLEAADVLVEQADLLIETADELVESSDLTVESVDFAIEAIDLLVEDAIAAFNDQDSDFCVLLMAAADTAIEALASEPAMPTGDEILGIMGGADLLVEAVDEIIHDDVLAKLEEAQGHLDNLDPRNSKERKAIRAVDAAVAATNDADTAIEAADAAVEDAIDAIAVADEAVEDASGCGAFGDLDTADMRVEDADDAVEDAGAAVEAADAAIEAADAAIEEADKRIEKALK